MKVIVDNPNNIVQNAFFNSTDLSFSLIINTVERWIKYDSYSINNFELKYYYYQSDELPPDTVTLITESQLDRDTIHRLRFYQQEKDQLWILMPVKSVYML